MPPATLCRKDAGEHEQAGSAGMNAKHLIFDGNYLCWRAFYAYGMEELSHKGEKTGVVYNFLNTVLSLLERYEPETCHFCFDLGESYRINVCRTYKQKRKELVEK